MLVSSHFSILCFCLFFYKFDIWQHLNLRTNLFTWLNYEIDFRQNGLFLSYPFFFHYIDHRFQLNQSILGKVHSCSTCTGTMKYSGAITTEWSDEWQSMTPSCLHQFQQQVCDHALYYIFSFNRYQMSTNTDQSTNHMKPFTINFTILLLSIFLLVVVSALIIVLLLLHRTEHLQVQDPLERGFLSSSIRNVLFRTFHDHHLRLLLPMAFFVGLEQGFFIADFNKVSLFFFFLVNIRILC